MFNRREEVVKYFAYGSNINLEQMRRRVGNVQPGIPHILKHWTLTFNAGTKHSMFTFANLECVHNTECQGLIYTLNRKQLDTLDKYEALYRKKFFRLPDGTQVFTYIAPDYFKNEGKKPLLNYLNTIIDGCVEAKLDKLLDYLIKYKDNNYSLKKGNKHKRKWNNN